MQKFIEDAIEAEVTLCVTVQKKALEAREKKCNHRETNHKNLLNENAELRASNTNLINAGKAFQDRAKDAEAVAQNLTAELTKSAAKSDTTIKELQGALASAEEAFKREKEKNAQK